jgi:hypothetical protein
MDEHEQSNFFVSLTQRYLEAAAAQHCGNQPDTLMCLHITATLYLVRRAIKMRIQWHFGHLGLPKIEYQLCLLGGGCRLQNWQLCRENIF